jgi:hypothetical protein
MLPHRWANAAGQGIALVPYTWLACCVPAAHLLTYLLTYWGGFLPALYRKTRVTNSNFLQARSNIEAAGAIDRPQLRLIRQEEDARHRTLLAKSLY